MVDIIGLTLNILTISALYALIAIGFTLIFGVGGIFNLAHGGLVAAGGFISYLTMFYLGANIFFGLIYATIGVGIIGVALYRGILHRIEDNHIAVLLITLLAGFFIQHTFGIFVTKQKFSIPEVLVGETTLAGYTVQDNMIFVFASSWVAIIAVFWLVERTEIGKSMIAMSMSKRGSAIVGIDAKQTSTFTWVIASMLAGFAGVLLTSFQTGVWNMGINPLMLSFVIVVLGGLGSIKGTVFAAYLVGGIEVTVTRLIDPQLTGVVPLTLLVVILLIRPQGLFGREVTASDA